MNILVYGFYDKGNLGDEFFKESFKSLFPQHQFTFTDIFTVELLKNFSTVFIGGGSFVYDAPKGNIDAIELLKSKDIFYIGIGIEKQIHPTHELLMKQAKLIAVRSGFQYAKPLNNNTILIHDIVYSLAKNTNTLKNNRILVLPNFSVVPSYVDPNWKHAAWSYFKSEFAQALNNRQVDYFPMCKNKETNDIWSAVEIVNFLQKKDGHTFLKPTKTFDETINLFSKYSCIITQRFHGIVLSHIADVPNIIIHHHDKLKHNAPQNAGFHNNKSMMTNYYGATKDFISKSIDECVDYSNWENKHKGILSIKKDMFIELKDKVNLILGG